VIYFVLALNELQLRERLWRLSRLCLSSMARFGCNLPTSLGNPSPDTEGCILIFFQDISHVIIP
jgi:hypothetical protein